MIPDQETIRLMLNLAELACLKQQVIDGKQKAHISLAEAKRRKGASVDRWIKERLIHPIQDGPNAMIRIDVVELEAVAQESNRSTYLTTEERKK